ncbi:hypothetical protein NDU88_004065 [Pleurodeles waltl]|uniref:Uncharacterized protein n=1 Tax=Pleurodeles waltl TaxID=8319 RepID=A0AAV7SHV1_PLEWA|nr:hypothetical protein NDU88_004065 [Pleurodeles waltl]
MVPSTTGGPLVSLVGMGLMRAEHRKLVERVQETERCRADMRAAQEALTQQEAALIDRVRRLEYHSENAEDRNRLNNVQIVGLLEGTE